MQVRKRKEGSRGARGEERGAAGMQLPPEEAGSQTLR